MGLVYRYEIEMPPLSTRGFAFGPVASRRIVISHWHDGRRDRADSGILSSIENGRIASGGQGHDSEVREEGQRV